MRVAAFHYEVSVFYQVSEERNEGFKTSQILP